MEKETWEMSTIINLSNNEEDTYTRNYDLETCLKILAEDIAQSPEATSFVITLCRRNA